MAILSATDVFNTFPAKILIASVGGCGISKRLHLVVSMESNTAITTKYEVTDDDKVIYSDKYLLDALNTYNNIGNWIGGK